MGGRQFREDVATGVATAELEEPIAGGRRDLARCWVLDARCDACGRVEEASAGGCGRLGPMGGVAGGGADLRCAGRREKRGRWDGGAARGRVDKMLMSTCGGRAHCFPAARLRWTRTTVERAAGAGASDRARHGGRKVRGCTAAETGSTSDGRGREEVSRGHIRAGGDDAAVMAGGRLRGHCLPAGSRGAGAAERGSRDVAEARPSTPSMRRAMCGGGGGRA